MSLFRSGSEEAFRAIHDRYRQRMFAYTRQMLAGSAVDAEDAVQEIFVRAYSGLRASDRELALRAWLYRIAHNRCIDELRRPQSVATDAIPATVPNAGGDPETRLEQRDALQRLIADVQRLPDQQRSALLMRELAGMTYADVAGALGVSVPAVKSLLVRARVGLAQANEARDTSCTRIREDLIMAHDRGVRASGLARRHLRDCPHCRQFRAEVRGVSRQLAAFVPALGPIGVIAKLLGLGGAGGGGAAAGSSAVAGGTTATATAAAAGGLAGGGAAAGVGVLASGHVVTLLAAAVVTAGSAIELQHMTPPTPQHARHHHAAPAHARATSAATSGGSVQASSAATSSGSVAPPAPVTVAANATSLEAGTASNPFASGGSTTQTSRHHSKASKRSVLGPPPSETMDPDHWDYLYGISGGANGLTNPSGSSSATGTGSGTSAPGTNGTSTTPAGGTATPPAATGSGSPTSTAGATPTTSSSATPTGGTSTSTSSGTPATGTSGGSATSSGSTGSTGSASSTGATTSTGKSNVAVTPATSTGSIDSAKLPPGARPHGHGTIAVFTMTGN